MCNLLPNVIFEASVIAVTLALEPVSEFPHDSLLADISKNSLDACCTALLMHFCGNESDIFGLH
jgi:hypothetical protein